MIELSRSGKRAGVGQVDRAATVFAVTALGAFMASLDLSIVNVAFPALQRSFERPALHAVQQSGRSAGALHPLASDDWLEVPL